MERCSGWSDPVEIEGRELKFREEMKPLCRHNQTLVDPRKNFGAGVGGLLELF